MIKKFIKISGTGKFLNYNTSVAPAPYRTTDFEKINLIYGENGSGKTTLAIILKSLKLKGIVSVLQDFNKTDAVIRGVDLYRIDPATGNKVYADFTPPPTSPINYLVTTNLGKYVYRCRPRFNSEYLYNIPELTRIGALNSDYNTYECWFSMP